MMRITFFLLALVCVSLPSVSKAQTPHIPHLTGQMLDKEGILPLKFKSAWKYHPGDDLKWAELGFEDSNWINIAPDGLSAKAMPDSLWQGYGWWRLHFTMDSSLYFSLTHLYFRSWGAAEVYVDGKKVSEYGIFSNQKEKEVNYVPRYVLDKPIVIIPHTQHVLAVRFSNQQAKRNLSLLKHNAQNLGFSIGFANDFKAERAESNQVYAIASLSIITALLILLLLLHLLLFFKFPKDYSNFYISMVIAFLLASAITNYTQLFMPLNGFSFSIIRGFINSTLFGLGLVLLPYTISLIFRLTGLDWTKHLIWIALIRAVFYFFSIIPIIIYDSVFIIIILSAIGFSTYKAIKTQKPGVHYITIGAIGTAVFLLIDRLYATNVITLTTEQFYIDLVLLFLCFPVGLSVYITSRYGTLFSAMEQEVAARTSDLNQSLSNLTAAQASLSAKNAENELLLKEIHHRVKNNLEVVSSLLALQSAQIDDPDVQAAMLASQNRVQSMGILHQKLYQSEHLAFIEMKNYFQNLCENVLDSYNITNKIEVDLPMEEMEMDVDTAVPIGLIVNELVTNSLKYAFPKGQNGKITISLENIDEKTYKLRIGDNGIGKTDELQPKGTGFGTQLVTLLTKQLDGKLEQKVENGTVISIYFKKATAA